MWAPNWADQPSCPQGLPPSFEQSASPALDSVVGVLESAVALLRTDRQRSQTVASIMLSLEEHDVTSVRISCTGPRLCARSFGAHTQNAHTQTSDTCACVCMSARTPGVAAAAVGAVGLGYIWRVCRTAHRHLPSARRWPETGSSELNNHCTQISQCNKAPLQAMAMAMAHDIPAGLCHVEVQQCAYRPPYKPLQ